MDAHLDKLLEKLLADTPLSKDGRRLLLGLPPVKPICCIFVDRLDDEDRGCCS